MCIVHSFVKAWSEGLGPKTSTHMHQPNKHTVLSCVSSLFVSFAGHLFHGIGHEKSVAAYAEKYI